MKNIYEGDNLLEAFSAFELCFVIEEDFHKPVRLKQERISAQLDDSEIISELPEATQELIILLYKKLENEVAHFQVQEIGILFPCINKKCNHIKDAGDFSCLQSALIATIQQKHQLIISLTQKIRQLLNNFTPEKKYSDKVKNLLNDFFLLENKLLQWIHIEQHYLFPETGCIKFNTP